MFRTRATSQYRPGQHQYYGSIKGFILTIILMSMMLTYFFNEVTDMHAYNKDQYSSLTRVNQFTPDSNQLNLTNENFMPSFRITTNNNDLFKEFHKKNKLDLFNSIELNDK